MTSAPLLLLVCLAGCAAPRVRIPGPLRPNRGSASRGAPAEPDRPVIAGPADDERAEGEAEASAERAGSPSAASGPTARRDRGDPALARAAARFVGRTALRVHGQRFRADCSGFVAAVYAQTGRVLSGSTADLYEQASAAGLLHRHKRPAVGDLAFFDDTYDRNGNGRRDDPLSHVAVVEAIADDGTIILVHYGSRGVARITMDLRHPGVHIDEDGILRNSYLRTGGGGDRTAGRLFRSFGSLWRLGGDS